MLLLLTAQLLHAAACSREGTGQATPGSAYHDKWRRLDVHRQPVQHVVVSVVRQSNGQSIIEDPISDVERNIESLCSGRRRSESHDNQRYPAIPSIVGFFALFHLWQQARSAVVRAWKGQCSHLLGRGVGGKAAGCGAVVASFRGGMVQPPSGPTTMNHGRAMVSVLIGTANAAAKKQGEVGKE